MYKASTADRLKQLMDQYHIKQVDILERAKPFCQKYGIKLGKNDLSQYVSGKVEPGQNKLFILGLALNVSEAWLMGYDVPIERKTPEEEYDHVKNILPLPETKSVPLIGTIACGTPVLAEENIECYVNAPESLHADFCLRCQGDSMINARILDGDIVFIRKQPDVDDGQIAAVLIDDEATLKRVYHNKDGGVTLAAENPAFAPMVFSAADCVEVRILGKAVAFLSGIE